MEFPGIGARKALADAKKATTPTNTARTILLLVCLGSDSSLGRPCGIAIIAIEQQRDKDRNRKRKGDRERGREGDMISRQFQNEQNKTCSSRARRTHDEPRTPKAWSLGQARRSCSTESKRNQHQLSVVNRKYTKCYDYYYTSSTQYSYDYSLRVTHHRAKRVDLCL